MAAELRTDLVVNVGNFLTRIEDALAKAGARIKSWGKSAPDIDVDVDVDTDPAESKLSKLKQTLGSLGGLAIASGIAGLGAALSSAIGKGSQFEAGVAELEAITGVAGESLQNLGQTARNLAKEFGGEATGQLDAFKGILSRLGPDIAKSPAALEEMTRAVNTLSAATGDDAAASMDALTTGLLQFEVALDDPVSAAAEMTKQMNVMAAGAKEGAAEVPSVAEAIKVAGVAASGAKVSFEETNAAIQALAAGGKVGAEAGTALRNVLGKLGEGRFLPKDVQEELNAAGVSIQTLSDTTVPLTTRLRELQKIQGDAALTTKLFGTENSAAASILIRSVDSIDDLTAKISGTNTAFDQAAVRQKTLAAGWERFQAAISDVAIEIYQAIGPTLSSALDVLTQALGGASGYVRAFVAALGDAAKFLTSNIDIIVAATAVLAVMSAQMIAAKVATIALTLAEKGRALVTKASAIAQAALNLVMNANPIMLVVTAIAALVAGFVIWYNRSEKVRNAVKAVWEWIKKFAAAVWDGIKFVVEFLTPLGHMVKVLKFVYDNVKPVRDAVDALVGSVRDAIQWVGKFLGLVDEVEDAKPPEFTPDPKNIEERRKAFAQMVAAMVSGVEKGTDTAAAALERFDKLVAKGRATAGFDPAEIEAARKKVEAAIRRDPPPDLPPPETGEIKKTILDFTEEAKKIREDAARVISQTSIDAINSELEKFEAAEKAKRDEIERTAQREQEANQKKLADAKAALKKGEVLEVKGFQEVQAAIAQRRDALLEQQRKNEEKARAELTERMMRAATEAEIAGLQSRQEAIAEQTAQALQERFDLERQIRARQISLLERDVATADSPAARAKAEAALQRARLDNARELAKAEREIDRAARREKIAGISSLAAQERETRLLELEERLDSELEANKLNEAKRIELLRAAAAERLQIERGFLQKTNIAYAAATAFRDAVRERFQNREREKAEENLAKLREDKQKEIQLAREAAQRGEISQKQLRDKVLAVSAEIATKEQEIQGLRTSIWGEANAIIASAFSDLLNQQIAKLGETIDRFISGNARMTDVLLETGVAITAAIGKAIGEQQNLATAALRAAGSAAFDFLQKMIPVWAASWMGVTLGETGLLGTPAAIAGFGIITALLEGLVAAARGILNLGSGTLDRFPDGRVPGHRSRGDVVPVMMTGEEVVLSPEQADVWLPIIRAARKGARMPAPLGNAYTVTRQAAIAERVAARAASELVSVAGKLDDTNAELAAVRGRLAWLEDIAVTNRAMAKQKPEPRRGVL